MSIRGRGTLEIRKSENPFYQPVSADIGTTSNNVNADWKVNGTAPTFNCKPYKVDGNFSFLYTRESDMIGSKVNKPIAMTETRMLTRSEFLKQRREKAFQTMTTENFNLTNSSSGENVVYDDEGNLITRRATAEDILQVYQHNPKTEDPRYLTTGVSTPPIVVYSLICCAFIPLYFTSIN